jgi:hypothetical protein
VQFFGVFSVFYTEQRSGLRLTNPAQGNMIHPLENEDPDDTNE